jgi:hypothetical protein
MSVRGVEINFACRYKGRERNKKKRERGKRSAVLVWRFSDTWHRKQAYIRWSSRAHTEAIEPFRKMLLGVESRASPLWGSGGGGLITISYNNLYTVSSLFAPVYFTPFSLTHIDNLHQFI